MDIRLPSGKVIKGVPDGLTKAQIKQRAISSGAATEADFVSAAPAPAKRAEAMTATQRYDNESQSLEETMGGFRETLRGAPNIPEPEDPTKASVPFAPPPSQQAGGGGDLGALGDYAPGLEKALSSAQASPSLGTQRPSQLPEVDLQSALRPKALGSETTQQVPRPIQTELLPEEKRKEYNYYEQNYANLDERSLEERKKANASSSEQVKRMQQFFDASNQGLQLRQNQILEKQRQAEIAKQTNPLLYQRLVQEISTDAKKFDREYKLLKINSDLVNDMTEKAQMDELMTARKDYEIKSKKGNTIAGLAYSITEGIGSGLAGAAEIGFKVIPSDQQIFEFLGLAEKSDAEKTKKSIEEKLELIRSGPTYWTGSGLFATPEFVQEDREQNLLYKGLYATADMVPALAAAYVGGSPAMMATYFTQSYDRNGQEMKGEFWDKISEPEKEAIRIGSAAVSAGISTLGFKALAGKMPIVNDIFFKAARKFVPNMTSGQIRRIIDAETKSYIGNLSSKLAQGFLIEGTEEAIDYTSEEALKTIYENYKRSEFGDKADLLFNNAESIKEFGNGFVDNFLVGGFVGDIIVGSMTAVTSIGARQRLNDKQFEVFKKIVGDGSLMDEFEASANAALNNGKMSRSDYDKAMEDLRVAKEVANQIPENLSTPATRKAFDLLNEKAKLKKKDQALVGDRIKEIDKELSRLSTERKPEPAPKAAEATPSAMEWSGEDVRYKGVKETTAPTMEWTGDQVTPKGPSKLELEAQKAEIEDKRSEEIERVNIAVAEASETGASPELDGRTINPEQEISSINAKYDAEIAALTQSTADAVQERTTAEVGAQPVGTEGAGQEGRGGVGPSVQGPEAPQAGGEEGQVTPPSTQEGGRDISKLEIRPSPDNINDVAEANDLTIGMSNEMANTFDLSGGVNLSDPSERKRVNRLKEQIESEDGYIARIIVDGSGNVVEGQHRLEAMRELGYKQIPVVRLSGIDDFIKDRGAVDKALLDNGIGSRDTRNQILQRIAEALKENGGNVSELLEYESPLASISKAWDAAIAEVVRQSTPSSQVAPTAEGPVRPEAPPAPAAAPAPTAAPVPRAETMKLMNDIASLEQKMEQTSNKGVKTRYQNQINKLAPKIGEVMAKFEATVKDLEKSGKLTRRCP